MAIDTVVAEGKGTKRKADDAGLGPEGEFEGVKAPIKVVQVAVNGDVVIKVRKAKSEELGSGNRDQAGKGKHRGHPGWSKDGGNEHSDQGDDEAVDIVVSSKVLCESSGMFKRMLEGSWSEAQTKTIQVEEAVTEAFLDFCSMIHGSFDNNKQLDREWVLHMIRIADMRDAVSALRPWMASRLKKHFDRICSLASSDWDGVDRELNRPFHGHCEDISGITIADIMILAAVFRFDGTFLNASKLYVATVRMGGDEDISGLMDIAPALLDTKKLFRILRRRAQQEFQDLLSKVKTYLEADLISQIKNCDFMLKKWSRLRAELSAAGLGPRTGDEFKGSVTDAAAAICKLAEQVQKQPRHPKLRPNVGPEEVWFRCTPRYPCSYCTNGNFNGVKIEVDGVVNNLPGICYPCFQLHDKDYWRSDCAKHPLWDWPDNIPPSAYAIWSGRSYPFSGTYNLNPLKGGNKRRNRRASRRAAA